MHRFFFALLGMFWGQLRGLPWVAADLTPWIDKMRVSRALGGKIEDLAAEHRVVVVMTTIPRRIDRIEPAVDSMLRQTWPIQALYLSVPHVSTRTGEVYTLPEWLQRKEGVQIKRCDDMGPGTHLLNGLRLVEDPWALIVVVDDDHIYAPDLVEVLVRSALAHPGSAVAAQGFLSVPGLKITKDMPRYLHDQGFEAGPVLVSYLGVIYQRGFFDDSVFDYSNVSAKCVYQDDMWFSAHLAKKGIKRNVIGAALGVEELTDMHLGPSSLTKWKENKPRDISEKCNDSLLRMLPGLWKLRSRILFSMGGLRVHMKEVEERPLVGDLARALRVLEALREIGSAPDMTYLCTAERGSSSKHRTLLLGGAFPVAVAEDCTDDLNPGVSKLIRSPLQWEGDSDTVIVVGLLQATEQNPGEFQVAVECAKTLETEPFCRGGELVGLRVGTMNSARRPDDDRQAEL